MPCATEGSTPWFADRWAILAVRVLYGNLAVPESEHIAAIDLDPGAVRPRSREHPLGHSPVPANKMARVTPVRIGERGPDSRKPGSDRLAARIASAADVRPCRGVKHTILRHERHESVDIVTIPRVGEGLQGFCRDLINYIRHDRSLQSVLPRVHYLDTYRSQ